MTPIFLPADVSLSLAAVSGRGVRLAEISRLKAVMPAATGWRRDRLSLLANRTVSILTRAVSRARTGAGVGRV